MHDSLWERNFDPGLIECVFTFFINIKIDLPIIFWAGIRTHGRFTAESPKLFTPTNGGGLCNTLSCLFKIS